MIQYISNKLGLLIENKSVLILGFGREGRSTYYWLRKLFPNLNLSIADRNTQIANELELKNDINLTFYLGENYLESIYQHTLVIKTPGISLKDFIRKPGNEIVSQTDIFFYLFKNQIIGVTGTKGKSTTVSLLFHLIKKQHPDCLLVGNIGIPAFDVFEQISNDSKIVFELSSHQLEFVKHSPKISILLNLFEEHLDHYNSYLEYQNSKFNITRYQEEGDVFIYHKSDSLIQNLIKKEKNLKAKLLTFDYSNADSWFTNSNFTVNNTSYDFDFTSISLKGNHNFLNICAVLLACESLNLSIQKCLDDLVDFEPLPHRMEYVGTYNEILFYNDSIATIPEACIQALKAIPNVETLILGGFDRGIHYTKLVDYLCENPVKNLIMLGKVGDLLTESLQLHHYKNSILKASNLDEVVKFAFKYTHKGKACLLSPAASSYDAFKNFEERGNMYKEKVRHFSLTSSKDNLE